VSGRVLVIDDSASVRAVLRAQLAEAELVVVEAEDGAGGLEVARDAQPDVVLLDIEMPGSDGFAVLEQLRSDEALQDIPVIFLTGKVDPDDVARGLRSGAHDYLRKPADTVELLARVRAALRTKRLQDELRERNEQLEQVACTDSLTHLYNRRFSEEELARLCARSRRHGRPLSVALFDVDGLRAVNKEHGYEVGDRTLVEIGQRLSGRKRAEDVLGRWGGEEFIVLMPDTPLEGALPAAEAFRSAVGRTPIEVGGVRLAVTVSGGVTGFADEDSPEHVIRRADDALQEAKRAGSDRVEREG
jgi:diguanylate cyclase (GGDEF)-like protein